MITIRKQEIVKLEDVLHLYQAVSWTNYINQPQMLEQTLSHSLAIYLALDGDALAQVREKIASFEFRPGTMDDAFIALTGREVR